MHVASGSNKRGKDGKPYGGFRRVVVAFDEGTFDEVRQRAIAQNTSFAYQVRVLVDLGLEFDLEEI